MLSKLHLLKIVGKYNYDWQVLQINFTYKIWPHASYSQSRRCAERQEEEQENEQH